MKLIFEAIYIFPHKINFNYKRNGNYHTITGSIFSILVYILLLFCLYKISEDCIEKKNPRLSIREKLFIDDEKLNFTEILESLNYTFNNELFTNNSDEN